MNSGALVEQSTGGTMFMANHLLPVQQQSPISMNGQQQNRHPPAPSPSHMMPGGSLQSQAVNSHSSMQPGTVNNMQAGAFLMAPNQQQNGVHPVPHNVGQNLAQNVPPAGSGDGSMPAMSSGVHAPLQSVQAVNAAGIHGSLSKEISSSLGIRSSIGRPGSAKKSRKGLSAGDVGG